MTPNLNLSKEITTSHNKHLKFIIYFLISLAILVLSIYLGEYFLGKYQVYMGWEYKEKHGTYYIYNDEYLIPYNSSVILIVGTVLATPIYFVYMILYLVKFIKACWKSIQCDGFANNKPSMAVGLLFIPIFNFYWIFVAFYSLSRQINNYIERHNLDKRNYTNKSQTLAFCVLTIAAVLIPVIGWFACSIISIILYFMVMADFKKASLYIAHNQTEN